MSSFRSNFFRLGFRAGLAAAALGSTPTRHLAAADLESPDQPAPIRERNQVIGIFQDVHLRPNEVAEQVVAIHGDASIEGRVQDQVVVVFGSTTITNDVDGQVVSVFGDLTVGPGVRIDDQLVAIGGRLQLDPTAYVRGQTIDLTVPRLSRVPGLRHLEHWLREGLFWGRLYPHNAEWAWMIVGLLLLFNLAFAAMFRGPLDKCTSAIERRPALSLINGLLVLVLTPPFIVLLVASVVGIVALPFLFAAGLFATVLGVIAVYRYCGAQLGLGAHPFLAIVAGHILFAILYAVPVIGLLAWNVVLVLGLGAAVSALFEARKREARGNGRLAPPPPSIRHRRVASPEAPGPLAPDVPEPRRGPEVPMPPASFFSPPSSETPPAAPPVSNEPTAIAPCIPSSDTTEVAPAAIHPPAGPGAPQPRADFWPRLAATLLDLVFIAALVIFVSLEWIFPYVWLAYHASFWMWRATTLGGIVMNLRMVRLDGRPIDFSVAVVRVLASVLSLIPLGLGFLWVHWDPEKQSWHDKIAGTTIVRVPRGQSLI